MPARQSKLYSLALWCSLIAWAGALDAADTVSPAEELLFLSDHFQGLPVDAVLRYTYVRAGSLQAAREGSVTVTVSPSAQTGQRQTHLEYVGGADKVVLPDRDGASGNPVILFFLEGDIREMQQLTGGQAAYFRKRVRLALADTAQVRPVTFDYAGRTLTGEEITIRPFVADPLRKRFERLAEKTYTFTMSREVPGTVYRMHTLARAAKEDIPLIEETLTLSGAEP